MSLPLINFGESHRLHFRLRELNYLTSAVMLGGLLFLFVLLGVVQKSRFENLRDRWTLLESEVGHLKQIKGVTGSESADGSGPGAAIRWTPLINEIARQRPETVWIESLEGAAAGENSVTIRGGAGNTEAVALFLERMNTTGIFRKVWSPSAERAENGVGIRFQVKGLF